MLTTMTPPRITFQKMILGSFVLGAMALGSPCLAQYQWRDANGQLVISDQAPPPNIKPSQIIKSAPMPVVAPAPVKADAKSSASSSAAKAPMTMAEKEAEFQKRRKEQADAQKSSAQKQAAAEQKAKVCESLSEKLRTLQSDLRITSVKKSGEVAAMEAAEREMEIGKTSKALNAQCSS